MPFLERCRYLAVGARLLLKFGGDVEFGGGAQSRIFTYYDPNLAESVARKHIGKNLQPLLRRRLEFHHGESNTGLWHAAAAL